MVNVIIEKYTTMPNLPIDTVIYITPDTNKSDTNKSDTNKSDITKHAILKGLKIIESNKFPKDIVKINDTQFSFNCKNCDKFVQKDISQLKFCDNLCNKTCIKKAKGIVNKKFQDTMRKEALRLEYAEKREKYKKHMKQMSVKKTNRPESIIKKFSTTNSSKICKAVTKTGKKCTNKAIGSTDFCGIISHAK